jgi:hypothetical protein
MRRVPVLGAKLDSQRGKTGNAATVLNKINTAVLRDHYELVCCGYMAFMKSAHKIASSNSIFIIFIP